MGPATTQYNTIDLWCATTHNRQRPVYTKELFDLLSTQTGISEESF